MQLEGNFLRTNMHSVPPTIASLLPVLVAAFMCLALDCVHDVSADPLQEYRYIKSLQA